MTDLALDLSGVSKRFGETVACTDLSFQAEAGQIMGLVGPDGAGKTTTFRILCGILAADSGQALVVGRDVAKDPEAVKREIGYLPQRFSLHRDLTVYENIQYMAQLYGLPRARWEARGSELLEITYLSPFRDRLAGRLSGGMKQKLALLCALIHRPKLLLLDEPTTGVDPVSRRDFWRILYDLPREGATVLISTPYMDEAARCNRVALMYEGHLLALDTPQRLREALPHKIMEVRCTPQREARQLLQQLGAVSSVEVFGDRLHVALRSGADPEIVHQTLVRGGIPCEDPGVVPASLEDVFMAVTTGEGLVAVTGGEGK